MKVFSRNILKWVCLLNSINRFGVVLSRSLQTRAGPGTSGIAPENRERARESLLTLCNASNEERLSSIRLEAGCNTFNTFRRTIFSYRPFENKPLHILMLFYFFSYPVWFRYFIRGSLPIGSFLRIGQ